MVSCFTSSWGSPHRGSPWFLRSGPFRPSGPSRGRRAQQRHLGPKRGAVGAGTAAGLQEEADVQGVAARGVGP